MPQSFASGSEGWRSLGCGSDSLLRGLFLAVANQAGDPADSRRVMQKHSQPNLAEEARHSGDDQVCAVEAVEDPVVL